MTFFRAGKQRECWMVSLIRRSGWFRTRTLLILLSYLFGIAPLILALCGCENGASFVPGDTMLIYSRSGGFAGLDDRLTIYSNGECNLYRKNSKQEFMLSLQQLAHLRELLDKANFFGLKSEYLPERAGADLIEYSITYKFGDKKHSVKTYDGAVPAVLQPLLDELNSIISNNAKQTQ